MKFITLPTYTKKIDYAPETVDWDSLGLQEPEKDAEYLWLDVKLNCKILNDELMLILPQGGTSILEFVDGSKLQINMLTEELEKLLENI